MSITEYFSHVLKNKLPRSTVAGRRELNCESNLIENMKWIIFGI